MNKIKIPWIEIILIIAGLLFILSGDRNAYYLGIGVMILAGGIFVARLIIGPSQDHNLSENSSYKPPPNSYKSDPYTTKQSTTSKSFFSSRNLARQEERKQQLDQIIADIRSTISQKLFSLSDIDSYTEEYVDNTDVVYIAKQLPSEFFSTSIWELHEKINNYQLNDEQILKILESGTDNLIDKFISTYKKNTLWTMSSSLFGQLITKNPLLLFHFTTYSKDTVTTIINRLSAYELMGYRTNFKSMDEEKIDSIKDLKKSTNEKDVQIAVYQKTNTNIICMLENMACEESLRQKAFDKIISGLANIISLIEEINELTTYEIQKIFERGLEEEIAAMFEKDSDTIKNLPEDIAIKILLELMYSSASEQVKDNYIFDNKDVFKKVINELSADELLGKGKFDIIKIIEDYMDDDENLRTLAFAKICKADDISYEIGNWGSVTEAEIKTIMERNKDKEISALLAREDSDNIIANLPEGAAIKILLELMYSDFADEIKDNYTFSDEDVFKKVISDLSADELLGKGEFDIIKIIEDYMSDDENLRTLAFAKICEADDISYEIKKWGSVTEEEIKTIMERNKDKEISALLGRENDDMITNMPDSYIIKRYLLEDEENIKDEYDNRIDDDDFKNKVEKTARKFSLVKLREKDKDAAVEDVSDEFIIKAKLYLIDLDECDFDIDDVKDEYDSRINNDDFKNKVNKLIELFT